MTAPQLYRIIKAGTIALGLLAIHPTRAQADTSILPYPPPYVQSTPAIGYPGASDYRPYMYFTLGPHTNDTRGVKTGTNADPAQAAVGLPNSKLGASPGQPYQLTAASARNFISAGVNPPQPSAPGVSTAGGSPPAALESATGEPPKTAALPVESAAPATDAYGIPLPASLLEGP
ncbi:hypothetical protein ACXPWS_15715 [Mycobacterium sp. BMJ-28]